MIPNHTVFPTVQHTLAEPSWIVSSSRQTANKLWIFQQRLGGQY